MTGKPLIYRYPFVLPRIQEKWDKEVKFTFSLIYPNPGQAHIKIFFTANFPFAEKGIQWTLTQRTRLEFYHGRQFPNYHGRIQFRFLNVDEYPPRWAKIGHLDNPKIAHILQILALPRS